MSWRFGLHNCTLELPVVLNCEQPKKLVSNFGVQFDKRRCLTGGATDTSPPDTRPFRRYWLDASILMAASTFIRTQ
jgi:hypothetical protein